MQNREKNNNVYLLLVTVALLELGKMLLPGYILTLDMPWSPDMPAQWNHEGYNNHYPIRLILYWLAAVIPSWMVQKVMVVSLFFLLLYIPWKYFPIIKNTTSRIFAAGLYVLNPFVYSRMLAGQWTHLFAYALLPFLLDAIIQMVRKPGRRSSIRLAIAFFALSLFSIHFTFLGLLFAGLAIDPAIAVRLFKRDWKPALRLTGYVTVSLALFLAASLYWIIPAANRPAPLEARFDAAHFEAYAAAENGVPAMLNVAALGGFWGERYGWRYYFSWPQGNPLFWTAFALIFACVLYGAYRTIKDPRTRRLGLLLAATGVLAYVTALGAADTPFKGVNLWLYENVPFWSGLRDSHKIAGFLALSYAAFAGVAMDATLARASRAKEWVQAALPYGFALLPILFGMYMWGGFQGQLRPVWYPQSWREAKAVLDAAPPGTKALVLPWHGYLSLEFNNQLVVANPAPSFFGHDRVIASRNTEIGVVYDQEADPVYRTIDEFLRSDTEPTEEELRRFLTENNIGYVLVLSSADAVPEEIEHGASEDDKDPFDTASTEHRESHLLVDIPTIPLIEREIVLRKVNLDI